MISHTRTKTNATKLILIFIFTKLFSPQRFRLFIPPSVILNAFVIIKQGLNKTLRRNDKKKKIRSPMS